jgi:hypothetical protein
MEQETTTTTVTTRSAGTRYGLILAGLSIVIFLIMSFAAIDMSAGIGRWATIPFYIAVLFMAHKYFKDEGDGYMTYGQGMGISFWCGLVCSVVYGVFFYVYVKFIDSSFVEAIKTKQIEQMQERGMSDAQIDQAMGFASMFMKPETMFFFALIGGVITMLIVGLVVSAFTQKKNPQGEMI